MNDRQVLKILDQRVVKTKIALIKALFELLETETIETISVTKLCKQAKVSRRTFYKHYRNIIEVFNDYKMDLSEQIRQVFSKKYTDVDILLQTFDEMLKHNYDGFKYLCNNSQHTRLLYSLNDMFYNSICELLLSDNRTGYNLEVLKFIASGINGIYIEWFRNSNEVNYDDLLDSQRRLIEVDLKLLRK
ncbi:MAG: TetR/AcrR family transcriptional regulator [Lentilactobacillus hilgardii]